ncbi:hypothetical protein ATANTOWER_030249 [Ataeniobius toweri]|uniref:Uncharacterized protein n=1 Tax=Ataeniobius toweri TaxID=208326 RepID=A0ABU7BL75_9TELE|nr:hypothetical protein [Ataeniobius toweri]
MCDQARVRALSSGSMHAVKGSLEMEENVVTFWAGVTEHKPYLQQAVKTCRFVQRGTFTPTPHPQSPEEGDARNVSVVKSDSPDSELRPIIVPRKRIITAGHLLE